MTNILCKIGLHDFERVDSRTDFEKIEKLVQVPDDFDPEEKRRVLYGTEICLRCGFARIGSWWLRSSIREKKLKEYLQTLNKK